MVKIGHISVFLLIFSISSSLFGATIKGSVFEDLNLNQKRDGGESGTGVHTFVKLCRDDVWIDSYEINTSNANGFYEFTISDSSKYTMIHDDSNASNCATDHTVHNEPGWSSSNSHFREVRLGDSLIDQDFAKFRDDHKPLELADMEKAYLFQNKPTDIYSIDLVTGDLDKVADDITPYSGNYRDNWHINGLGFNVEDRFMWGSTPKENKISRIGKDSSGNWVQMQFNEIEGLGTSSYTGDIDDNGILYILPHRSTSRMIRIDLHPESKDYLKATSIDLLKKGTLNKQYMASTDWAINPIDDMIYTVNNGIGKHYLWRIDPQTGEVERLGDAKIDNPDHNITGSTGNLPPGHPTIAKKSRVFGGSFFTADGYYYLYDNGPGRTTGEVFRIDVTYPSKIDSTAVPFSKPRKTSLNDGVMWAGNVILLDFGDAPDDSNASSGDGTKEGNYRTLLSDNGPRHRIHYFGPTVYLGVNPPDDEADANATKDALGDGNDDDGVIFEGKLLQGAEIVANSKIDLEITTAGNGFLNAWIDWNSDGNFTSSEQIAKDENGFSGSISLKNIKVPSKMKTGVMTVARFRYSTDMGLESTGPAKDGEVEDYMVNITSGNEFGVWDTNLTIANQIIRTKIVNQDINLTISSLDKNSSKFMTSSYENVKAAIFANSKQLTVWKDVNLTDTNSTDVMFGKIDEAHRIAYVRVKYGDANVTSDLQDTNLSEKFAIRPDKFVIGAIAGPLKAGAEFSLNITAVGIDGIPTPNYNEASGGYTISLDEELNATCPTGTTVFPSSSAFVDGSFSATATYSEVGKVTAKIKDKGFASIDINDTSPYGRMIGSASSPPIVFEASHFELSWNFMNASHPTSDITYFSSLPNIMGARLDIELDAQNALGANLANYTASCYAKNINTNVDFSIRGTDGSSYLPTWSVDGNTTPTSSTTSLILAGVTNGSIDATTSRNRFFTGNAGRAETRVWINLQRDLRVAAEPINFIVTNVNSTDGVATGASSTPDIASLDRARFYYTRAHAPDYQAVGRDFNATVFYEIYCQECNRADFPRAQNSRESVDSVFWYILTPDDFDSLAGGIGGFPRYLRGVGTANVVARDTISLRATQTPYVDRIIYEPDSWLIYNRFRDVTEHSFLIEHHSPNATWSGKGQEGERMDTDASRRKSEKMDW